MIKWKSQKQEIFCTEYLPTIACVLICVISYFILNMYPAVFPQRIHCFSSAALFCIPVVVYLIFKWRFPPILKIIGFGFIFCGMLFATAMNLYSLIPEWDTILHTLSGVMCFLFAYYVLLATGVLFKVKEALGIVICLLLNASTSSVWELIEYAADGFGNGNAQHSLEEGVVDTMQDIIANTIGGLAVAIFMIVDILINKRKVTDWFTRHVSVYTRFDYRKPMPLEENI